MRLANRSAKANSRKTGFSVSFRLSRFVFAATALATAFSFCTSARAQKAPDATPAPAEDAAPTADNAVMLTVFFKHDQSRPLGELNAQLERQGFYKAFPPAGIEVVSWYVDDGNRPGGYASASSQPPSRGQSYPGKHRLGQLSHGILSNLRLQTHGPGLA